MKPVHRIKRQIIELELPHDRFNSTERKELGRKISLAFTKALDQHLSEADEHLVRIPLLDFDLGAFPVAELQAIETRELNNRCSEMVQQQVQAILQKSHTKDPETTQNKVVLSKAQQGAEALTHFLSYGRFPWWARKSSQEFLAQFQHLPFDQVVLLAQQQPAIIGRLLHHWKDAQLLQWAEGRIPATALDLLSYLLQKLKASDAPALYRKTVFEQLFHATGATANRLAETAGALLAQEGFRESSFHLTLQKDPSTPGKAWQAIFKKAPAKPGKLRKELVKAANSSQKRDSSSSSRSENELQKSLAELQQLLVIDLWSTQELAAALASIEQLSRLQEFPEIRALANDLLPLLQSHKAHQQRQAKGLSESILAELRLQIQNINQQFDLGELPPKERSNWKNLAAELERLFAEALALESPLSDAPPILANPATPQESNLPTSPTAEHLMHYLQDWLKIAPAAFNTQAAQELLPHGLNASTQPVWVLMLQTGLEFIQGSPINANLDTDWVRLTEALHAALSENKVTTAEAPSSPTTQETAFPKLDSWLQLWRQWTSGISSTNHAQPTLLELQRWAQRNRWMDPSSAGKQMRQEVQWLVREVKPKLETDGEKPTQRNQPSTAAEDRYFLSNAGLVVIWSFLPHLLSNLGWTENQEFKSEAYRERALMLLHYVVCEQTEALESELLLNKILLGWPIDAPCAVEIVLTSTEKEAVEEMLTVILGYNQRLKKGSVDGFRGNFLLREGGLSDLPDCWQMHVEQKPFDIMLDGFPWSWNTVKSPWMDKAMFVAWG